LLLTSKHYQGKRIGGKPSAINTWSGGGRQAVEGFNPNEIVGPNFLDDRAKRNKWFHVKARDEAGGKSWITDEQIETGWQIYKAGGLKQWQAKNQGRAATPADTSSAGEPGPKEQTSIPPSDPVKANRTFAETEKEEERKADLASLSKAGATAGETMADARKEGKSDKEKTDEVREARKEKAREQNKSDTEKATETTRKEADRGKASTAGAKVARDRKEIDGGKRNKADTEKNVKAKVTVDAPEGTKVKVETTGDLKQDSLTRLKSAWSSVKAARAKKEEASKGDGGKSDSGGDDKKEAA
jgi:hypothetical protein